MMKFALLFVALATVAAGQSNWQFDESGVSGEALSQPLDTEAFAGVAGKAAVNYAEEESFAAAPDAFDAEFDEMHADSPMNADFDVEHDDEPVAGDEEKWSHVDTVEYDEDAPLNNADHASADEELSQPLDTEAYAQYAEDDLAGPMQFDEDDEDDFEGPVQFDEDGLDDAFDQDNDIMPDPFAGDSQMNLDDDVNADDQDIPSQFRSLFQFDEEAGADSDADASDAADSDDAAEATEPQYSQSEEATEPYLMSYDQ